MLLTEVRVLESQHNPTVEEYQLYSSPFEQSSALQSILDAGGDCDPMLSGLLYRHICRLEDGHVLEIISRNPKSRMEVPAWCERTGNQLYRVIEDGDETVYWILKIA